MLLLLVIWALVWALLQLVDLLPHHARVFRVVLLALFVVWLLWAFVLGGPTLRVG